MNVGGLFSGIGGIELGLTRAGMNIEWMVEIDPFCRKVLAKHWPHVPIYSDVQDVRNPLQPVDLIAGGFPCQPHSVAGKRRGTEDDRNLWPDFKRIVGRLRPRWVFAENVPGIRTTILDEVLSDLEGMAYSHATFVVPAAAFDAYHIRKRVWILAHAKEHKERAGLCESEQAGEWRGRSGDGSSARDIALSAERRLSERKGVRSRKQATDTTAKTPEQWPAKPGMAGVADGVPYRLDGVARWNPEPDIPRTVTDVPNRIARTMAIGNAVVPAIAEWFGRIIMEADNG